jgi:hypothetical protein
MGIPGFTAKASLTSNIKQEYNVFSNRSFSLTSSDLQLNQSGCPGNTSWGEFERGTCENGRSRRSAVLNGIRSGCSWEDACRNKGATIDGTYYSRPDQCVNNGFNIHGIFYTPCTPPMPTPTPDPTPDPTCGGPTSCPLGNWLETVGCHRWCRPCNTDDHCGLACVNCRGSGCFRDFGGYRCGV